MSTHDIPFLKLKKKIILNYPKSAAICSNFQGAQERERNSRGKRAISVRAIEVLLYIDICTIKEKVDVSLMSSSLKRRHIYKTSEKHNEIRRSTI